MVRIGPFCLFSERRHGRVGQYQNPNTNTSKSLLTIPYQYQYQYLERAFNDTNTNTTQKPNANTLGQLCVMVTFYIYDLSTILLYGWDRGRLL